jgi:Spy/CpxP family protein refolding chaperone
MKKSTKTIAIVLVTLGITSTAFAFGAHQGWRMSPEDKAEFMTGKITEKLELDTSQQQNLQSLSETVLQIMKDVRSNRVDHMDTVQAMLSEPSLDQAKALEMVRQKTDMINARAPAVVASIAGFLDSLDSDQKELLREHMNSRMHHRHQNH